MTERYYPMSDTGAAYLNPDGHDSFILSPWISWSRFMKSRYNYHLHNYRKSRRYTHADTPIATRGIMIRKDPSINAETNAKDGTKPDRTYYRRNF